MQTGNTPRVPPVKNTRNRSPGTNCREITTVLFCLCLISPSGARFLPGRVRAGPGPRRWLSLRPPSPPDVGHIAYSQGQYRLTWTASHALRGSGSTGTA
eukprot:981588-Rhodomonas_salina.1